MVVTCSNYFNFWVQVIMEVPYVFIQTTYFTLIVYAMLWFDWTVVKIFWFFFVTFFTFLYFTYYGMMTVSITPNHQVAAIFAASFYSLFNLFSGFFIPRPVSQYTRRVVNSFSLSLNLLRITKIYILEG